MITKGSRVRLVLGARTPKRWVGTVTSVDAHAAIVQWGSGETSSYHISSLEEVPDDEPSA